MRFVHSRAKSKQLHLSEPNFALSALFRSWPRVPNVLDIGNVADTAGGRAAQLGIYCLSVDILDILGFPVNKQILPART
jgi:hypothetical protein